MSAEELSKLSLADTMVTTRAGAARARTAPPQNTQNSPSASPAASPTPSLIESAEGQQYDVSTFDEDLRRRAKRGLMDDNDISMKLCKEIEDGPKRYLFHLEDDITVALREDHAPKCSCGANEGGKACKHIFWTLGQLTSTVPKARPLQLAEDGSSVRDMHPADIVGKFTLEKIATNLDWVYQEEPLPDEDEMEDEIANMLSVFEPTQALPAEFKDDEAPDLTEQSRKYRELRDLLSQHAAKNPALFIQLQEIIPPVFQVQVFFDKINHRIDRAFAALGEYIASGPTNAVSEALDVQKCAERVQGVVKAVAEYYNEQVENDTGHNVAVLAAAALVKVLDEVTKRDHDAYANISWGVMPPTNAEENNLSVCLIGAAVEGDGLFVIDTLLDLPQEDVLRNHYEVLSDIEGRLRGTEWTPPAYMDAMRRLIHDKRKRAASQSGGGSAKRAMQ
ncbi:hypothetical protein K458DRAFT_404961 [Lentithecium fluviatile CBS 122367]|uniref:SWIM-type domain-containing protein n=1 Tax=Lentithecium fluviatile CBS 122367 TaxID=1168545 RepID=A0A6G1IZ62_9PLEO|nr:hypothetical protein K458DRAFT_404961 [Lentithecium fluviatile CBS 122367]